jgi:hypothetical protein
LEFNFQKLLAHLVNESRLMSLEKKV